MWHFTGEGQVYHRDETSGTPVTINWSSLSQGGNVWDTRDNKVVKFITGRKRLGHPWQKLTMKWSSLSHGGNVWDIRDNKVVKFITGRKRLGHPWQYSGQVYHREETSGTPVTIKWSSLSHGGNVWDTRDNTVVKFITRRKRLGHPWQ